MNMIQSERSVNGVRLLTIENDDLRVEVAPSLGGKVTSVYNKQLKNEFLWHNDGLPLAEQEAGADYDSNFWGGIDELLPNDIPETVDGVAYPDHGELWTTQLDYKLSDQCLSVYGLLPRSGLFYEKALHLHADAPKIKIEYRIENRSGVRRHFLWKLHAALRIREGDRLVSRAGKGRVVYPESSRFPDAGEFQWPFVRGVDAAVVPAKNGTMDFFYLYDSPEEKMGFISEKGQHLFSYQYDQTVFPYQWYFASYGQFLDHYTAILEPASAMPVSVGEAAGLGQCSVLDPGEKIQTTVTIYAGENR